MDGQTFVPGQGNNAYIFPGVGLGVIAAGAHCVTDEMFFVAVQALARQVTAEDLAVWRVLASLSRIRYVSVQIAAAVAEVAYVRGLTQEPKPVDLVVHIRSPLYEPQYPQYIGNS